MILSLIVVFLILIVYSHAWIFRITRCQGVGLDYPGSVGGSIFGRAIYACTVEVERSESLTTLVNVVGSHPYGQVNSDIEYLTINTAYLEKIPSNIDKFLPNLIGFVIRSRQATSITAEDLRQFPNIIYFGIYDTSILIPTLDSDLFKYTPHIEGIAIYNTSIEHVGKDLLTNLNNLKNVHFARNPCLDNIDYVANNPEKLQWLNENLLLRCSSLPTPAPTDLTSIPVPTVPVGVCEIRCSINEEIDELNNQLMEQGVVIKGLNEVTSSYSHRIFELENLINKMTNAICRLNHNKIYRTIRIVLRLLIILRTYLPQPLKISSLLTEVSSNSGKMLDFLTVCPTAVSTKPSENQKIIFTNIALDCSTVGDRDQYQVWARSRGEWGRAGGSEGLLATLSRNLPQVPINIEVNGSEEVVFSVVTLSGPPRPVHVAFYTADKIIPAFKTH